MTRLIGSFARPQVFVVLSTNRLLWVVNFASFLLRAYTPVTRCMSGVGALAAAAGVYGRS